MKLYCAPHTISVAVAIALHEAGLPHELRMVDFAGDEQRGADYARINPKGRVPALVLQDGAILTETGAILDYVAGLEPALMPADPLQAAQVRSVMYFLASTMHVNHAHKRRGHRWADRADSRADMAAKVPETMTASAQFIENHCLTGPFLMGEAITVADCYLFQVCTWLPGDGVDMQRFPRIGAFMQAMESRASVGAVRATGLLG